MSSVDTLQMEAAKCDSSDDTSEEVSFSDDMLVLGLSNCKTGTKVNGSKAPCSQISNENDDSDKIDVNDMLIAGCEEQMLLAGHFGMNFDDNSDEPSHEFQTKGEEENEQDIELELEAEKIETELVREQNVKLDLKAEQQTKTEPESELEVTVKGAEEAMLNPETGEATLREDENIGELDATTEEGPNLAEFDLDALFFETEGISDHSDNDDSISTLNVKEVSSTSINSPTRSVKRPLTPLDEGAETDSTSFKRQKSFDASSDFHFPTGILVTPEPVETLTPESSTVPSPECPIQEFSLASPLGTFDSSLVDIESSSQKLKSLMLPVATLVKSYASLKQTSAAGTALLTETNTQLTEANQCRFALADQNAKLRAEIQSVTKEKECLKAAITKLHNGTNGLKKNEMLMLEIEEKNLEIVRL